MDMDIDSPDFEEAMSEETDIKFAAALEEEMAIVLPQVAEIIRGWLEDYTPRGKTSETATSWRVIAFGPGDYDITNSNEPIITFLTEGTTRHWIEPVTAKALHWTDDSGQDFFSKGHWVEGIDPTDIVGMALLSAEAEIDPFFDAAIDAAWRDVNG